MRKNNKHQITNYKQITMTKIQNPKLLSSPFSRSPGNDLFWSLYIGIWNLFVIRVLKFGALKLGACHLEFTYLRSEEE